MVKLKEFRKDAITGLISAGNSDAAADVDFLLQKLLGLDKSQIILGDKELTDDETQLFNSALGRLRDGEPVQYIAGKCEFMSLEFKVSPATLIPRADTEILVEKVISLAKGRTKVRILEIGCGSGCIAISLAYYIKDAEIFTLDISKEALNVAEENASALGVSDRVKFFEHDILKAPFEEEQVFDIVVSNPPYIPSDDISRLEKKVREFEPGSALDGGEDGLIFYRKISDFARLSKDGCVAFEVGINQTHEVCEIMRERFSDIEITKDLSGIERVVTGRIKLQDKICKS